MNTQQSLFKTLLVLHLQILLYYRGQASQCVDGDVRLVDQDTSDPDRVSGVVQLCTGGKWSTACRSQNSWYWIWNTHAADLVCKQLGYSSEGSTSGHTCGLRENQYIQQINCEETASVLRDCEFITNGDCVSTDNCHSDKRRYATVACLKATCPREAIRLVGGSSSREGRVEVCVDGRWGTVCNDSQEGIAEGVCSQLGFPSEGENLTCSLSTDTNCDSTVRLGLMCRTHQEVETNQTINAIGQQCSEGALGGVVGVLLTVLVVLVIGWSLSCVALVKRHSSLKEQTPKVHKQKIQLSHSNTNDGPTERQLDNPMYGANINIEAHNYSSSGPTYELVDTNEGAGQTHAALDQSRESSNEAQTTSEDDEHLYHILECGESEGVTVGRCEGVTEEKRKSVTEGNYEVPRQTHSRVWLCEEEYSTIEH